jgi:glycosyltransferase involved in cell wall biosynthesis
MTDGQSIPVAWEGEWFVYHSLAHVNREVALRLVEIPGFELTLYSSQEPKFDPGRIARYAPLLAERPASSEPRVHVRHEWPPSFTPPRAGAWVIIQPLEFGGLPEEWIRPMRDVVDEIWVPSTWVRENYLKSGVPAEKVVVIPNGVDTGRFKPEGRGFPLATRKRFKFLFLGGLTARKGLDLLLEAYRSAFSVDDDVCLVLKAAAMDTVYKHLKQEDILAPFRSDPAAPEVVLLEDSLDDDQVAALYRSVDALVHPYRGEGFALPVAEAMASGLPVLVTDKGACVDYCDISTSILLPAREVSIDYPWLPPGSVGYWWAEPDPVRLREAMQEIWRDPDRGKEIGARARERIVAGYTWEAVANRYAERIKVLASRRPVRFAPGFIDSSVFNPDVPPVEIEEARGFNFLLRPNWGVDAWKQALAAYLSAFSARDDVALVVRGEESDGDVAQAILAAVEELGHSPDEMADVVILDQTLSPRRLGGLYTACQALIDLGESDHAREAAACGLCIAAPDFEALRSCAAAKESFAAD